MKYNSFCYRLLLFRRKSLLYLILNRHHHSTVGKLYKKIAQRTK